MLFVVADQVFETHTVQLIKNNTSLFYKDAEILGNAMMTSSRSKRYCVSMDRHSMITFQSRFLKTSFQRPLLPFPSTHDQGVQRMYARYEAFV